MEPPKKKSGPCPLDTEKLAEDYRHYLLQERGLSQATAINYLPFIEQFLSERFEKGRVNLSTSRARRDVVCSAPSLAISVLHARVCSSPLFVHSFGTFSFQREDQDGSGCL